MPQTNEKAFETYVAQMLLAKGWQQGSVAEWDKEQAFFPEEITGFIAATQAPLWKAMRTQHGDNLEPMLLAALVKELAIKGSLHVLRHGFKFYGKTFRLAYFKPAHGLNAEVLAQYEKNRLTVTRQVPCHPGDHSTMDLVFAVNGLPVATCELKNPGTGQSWRNAVKQYKEDRNSRAPLFAFKERALVHFAADPDEVYMTTRLAGGKTFFSPATGAATPVIFSVGQVIRSILPATAPVICGKKYWSARAFSTSSATSSSLRRRMKRWTTPRAAAGWSLARR